MNRRILQWYFNHIYTPVYDFSVAQSKPYLELQALCLNKLSFKSGDHIICIGVGTGNEISRILYKEPDVRIKGIDTSRKALNKACGKSLRHKGKCDFLLMDAHKLDFADATFDIALCLHVMGFLQDDLKATQEIYRVLKQGGQFAVTYPSGIGSIRLAGKIAHCIWHDIKSFRLISASRSSVSLILGGLVYIPISSWIKPSSGFYSRQTLNEMVNSAGFSEYRIDEDIDYQDYIVSGTK